MDGSCKAAEAQRLGLSKKSTEVRFRERSCLGLNLNAGVACVAERLLFCDRTQKHNTITCSH